MTRTYKVAIVETSVKYVEVDADSKEEAVAIVEQQWNDSLHVLDESHFDRVDFSVIED